MATPLVYILHSGQLFGTERMAVRTLAALEGCFDRTIVAPAGPVHDHARAHGLRTVRAGTPAELARFLWRTGRTHRACVVAATGLSHTLVAIAMQWLSGCPTTHVHVVHGGTDERLSYGRKRLLLPFDVRFVAVSGFVRERLAAHGVPPGRVTVIENFIDAQPDGGRPAFAQAGVRRVVVLSRLDRIKRVGLLVNAVRRTPALADMHFDIYGSGEEHTLLRESVADLPNVRFHGFAPDASARLREADLLVHTCAEEPFGLAILEAFAAGVPVLVPNAGGAGALVQDCETGFHFAANDAAALARALQRLHDAPAALLNGVADAARATLAGRFAPARQTRRYLSLLGAWA
ncbi:MULTISPECIES: glycosyltransferase family 4 protein [Burkholderia]|uniref:Group 1 glycosyl transferase n=1 Tax=Burkholderia paludis TaxID=1506587 RepID=A0A6J5CWB0_9BURK|nr:MULTISPECIES: glycosyltransferase family 4 protein [Burkholderia]CAB3746248.1 D-inositol-3-phosphate glycosyltransferase [Burkholderia paludis]VWB23939.1 group 1 glycosyl transferase [Burkholderia paludis]